METTWDKTRAIGFAVGMHVLVLTLLCLGFMRESQQQITRTHVSIIEASLVSAPPQSKSRLADLMPRQPKLVALRVPPPSIVNQVKERQAKEQSAEHSEPQDSDVLPNQALIDPSRQQQPDDGYPQHLAQQHSDPQDLLQEMRKQRAEQERQRQLTAQGRDAQQDQRIQHAQVGGPDTLPVPAYLLAENGITDQRFLDPFSTSIQFNLGADGIPDEGRQLMNCPVAAFQQHRGDMIPMDWIDCLLNSAISRLTGQIQMMQTIDFPHIGFAQISSIQGVEVDHIGTGPQATPVPQADHRAFEPDN